MLKKVCYLIFFFTFFFLFPLKAYAVSVFINDTPTVITTDVFTLSVSVIGASSGTNYLRADLYKEGTTNYFGETFNGNGWYAGSDGKQYFPITVPNDNPFTIQVRIGDTIPNEYDGTGIYKVRVRRYTAGGNYNNDEAKASAVTIGISFPTPTVAPTNSPTPTKIPTPTKVPTPTKSPTPTKIPTPLPPIKSGFVGQAQTKVTVATNTKPTEVEDLGKVASSDAYPTAVLGSVTSASPTAQKLPNKKTLVKASSNGTAVIASSLIVGGLFLVACAILIFFRIKKQES